VPGIGRVEPDHGETLLGNERVVCDKHPVSV
jgi:hypothetical protein